MKEYPKEEDLKRTDWIRLSIIVHDTDHRLGPELATFVNRHIDQFYGYNNEVSFDAWGDEVSARKILSRTATSRRIDKKRRSR